MARLVSFKPSFVIMAILLVCFAVMSPDVEAQSDSDSVENEHGAVLLFSADPQCESCSWLQFNGEITKDSASELKQALSRWRNTKVVQLNSAGGSVWEATQLGLWLRARNVTTVVADTVLVPSQSGEQYSATPATCLSACTYLFAAGKDRLVLNGSLVGVHQFYTDDFSGWTAADAMSVAQLVQADLSDYLDVMGVSNRLLTIAGRQDSEGMDFLNPIELQELNLATESYLTPNYFAELFALNSQQETNQSDSRSAEEIFKHAKSLLLKFDYPQAEREFRAFLNQYGDDFRAPEATYWLGEVLYQQGFHVDAGLVNSDMIRKFPADPRAPEVLVKLARNLRLVGDPDSACQTLDLLPVRYPVASGVTRNLAATERIAARCDLN